MVNEYAINFSRNFQNLVSRQYCICRIKRQLERRGGVGVRKEFICVASKMPAQWGHLVYLNDWEICVPEMMEIIQRLVTWCIENGLLRAANVYDASDMKSSLVNKMVVQQEGAFLRAVFDNDADAAAWLTEEGFPPSITS